MSTQHTPVPWRVGKDDNVHAGFLLAELRGIYAEKNANAAFIVRACNNHDALLAALIDAENMLDQIRHLRELDNETWDAIDKTVDAARTAIAACEVQS